MSNTELSRIRTLEQIELHRLQLERQASKQERGMMRQAEDIKLSWRQSLSGFFRFRNIVRAIVPKLEYVTMILPFVTRLFRRHKK